MSSLNIEIFGCLGVSIGARVLELLGKLGMFGFELEYVCLGFCDPAFDLLARLADRFTLFCRDTAAFFGTHTLCLPWKVGAPSGRAFFSPAIRPLCSDSAPDLRK